MNSINTYIENLMKLYSKHIDRDYAAWSENYMRNQFDFLGVRSPIRKKLTRQFLAEYGHPETEMLADVVFALWDQPEREYQYAALDIIQFMKKALTPDDTPWLSTLIVQKSWWDTVDVISPHIMGYMFQQYPELISRYADQWIKEDNIWLQRSAVLYQLKYKDRTDGDRLFRFIGYRAESEEFFVQKAIGWALREYGKFEPKRVKEFVGNNHLKPLSKREAMKHLQVSAHQSNL